MGTTSIQQTNGIKYALKRARILNSEDYKFFMKNLDSWTGAQLAKIETKKYPKLEKEAAIDMVFFRRENEIKKKQRELLPPRNNCIMGFMKVLGLF